MVKKLVSLNVTDALRYVQQLQAQRRFTEAEAACDRILAAQPNNMDAFYLSGVLKLQMGAFEAARDILSHLVKKKPDSSEILGNLAAALIHLNDLKTARAYLERALAINPENISTLLNLSTVHLKLGSAESALETAKKAQALYPQHSQTYASVAAAMVALSDFRAARIQYYKAVELSNDVSPHLGNLIEICLRTCRYKEAIRLCDRSLKATPQKPETLSRKAQALAFLGKNVAAIECMSGVDTEHSEFLRGLLALAQVFRQMGNSEDALSIISTALDKDPDNIDLLHAKGAAYLNEGDQISAAKVYHQILGLDPTNVQAMYVLSGMKSTEQQNSLFERLMRLRSYKNLDAEESYKVDFAIARHHERLSQYEKQFSYLKSANNKKRAYTGYSIERDVELFDKIRQSYTTYLEVESRRQVPQKSEKHPIFIIGMPRSGTSLTEQILSSHSEVFGGGELRLIERQLGELFRNAANSEQIIGRDDLTEASEICNDFLEHLGDQEQNVTDKMPLNFRFIGFLERMFPSAKFIHVKRDPRATCWSIYSRSFAGTGNGFAEGLVDLARFYKLYLELMAFWHSHLPGKIYDLNYEALTQNQERETKKLLEHCNLCWEDECLDFHLNSRSVRTASALQVRQKMYQGSSEVWKRYQAHLDPMLRALDDFGVPLPD